jgi:hypothetical protein
MNPRWNRCFHLFALKKPHDRDNKRINLESSYDASYAPKSFTTSGGFCSRASGDKPQDDVNAAALDADARTNGGGLSLSDTGIHL